MSECHRLPSAFGGVWQDLEGVGYREVGAVPSVTYGLRFLLGPVGFAKFYAPLALLLLGLSAWWFFRCSGLSPGASVLGGLAAALNSSFFSAACWGVASHPITVATAFLAMAALSDVSSGRRWLRVTLAGLAVGLGVTEGYDIGAMFSGCVAAFILYQAWTEQRMGQPEADHAWFRRIGLGLARLLIVALFAGFLAARAVSVLIGSQIEGVAGAQQDTRTKQERWDWATQWSLPKREALAVVVPGLFGYLWDTPEGSGYWGASGRTASWISYLANGKQGPPPSGLVRQTGGGNYAGVSVVLVAVWAAIQSLRRRNSAFSLAERKRLWLWVGLGLVGLLLAFGRYAPFYRLVYALPYASTVRNPTKFMHVLALALVILFGYGAEGLLRTYSAKVGRKSPFGPLSFESWWTVACPFDRRWVLGSFVALAVSIGWWIMYARTSESLERYLQWVEFNETAAARIASFSIRQCGWFVLFLTLSCSLVMAIISGRFVGGRARWGGLLLGGLLLLDLGRANLPWINYFDANTQYASNPILDFLRQRPFEHRVGGIPGNVLNPAFRRDLAPPPEIASREGFFLEDYRAEWLSHLFAYYNVQATESLHLVRTPQDLKAFNEAFQLSKVTHLEENLTRYWQLTNTRYLLGGASLLRLLNERFDPIAQRFRIVERFELMPRPGVVGPIRWEDLAVTVAPEGSLALFEFAGALPRARLYSQWQVQTNRQAALGQLTSPTFDPEQTVLVSENLHASSDTTSNQTDRTVEFQSYGSKTIELTTASPVEAILLLNDRYDPNWKVYVDGKPELLLECNYVMRGVHLNPGTHSVKFLYRSAVGSLYVSLCAIAVGVFLLGFLAYSELLVPPPARSATTTPVCQQPQRGNKPIATSRSLVRASKHSATK